MLLGSNYALVNLCHFPCDFCQRINFKLLICKYKSCLTSQLYSFSAV